MPHNIQKNSHTSTASGSARHRLQVDVEPTDTPGVSVHIKKTHKNHNK